MHAIIARNNTADRQKQEQILSISTYCAHESVQRPRPYRAIPRAWAFRPYHGLRRQHLDAYLNEFVFRYNRRFYRHVSFETVLGLAVRRSPISYWDITGQQNPRKNATPTRRNPRRRKTTSGMRQDGVEPAEAGETWVPGTTE